MIAVPTQCDDQQVIDAANALNERAAAIAQARANHESEARQIVDDALSGSVTAVALRKRLERLRDGRLQADMDELPLMDEAEAVVNLLRNWHKARSEHFAQLERERRTELEKVCDDLGYPGGNPAPQRHRMILDDPKRRELEAASKSHHDHVSSVLMGVHVPGHVVERHRQLRANIEMAVR